jgi:hypothetical protein
MATYPLSPSSGSTSRPASRRRPPPPDASPVTHGDQWHWDDYLGENTSVNSSIVVVGTTGAVTATTALVTPGTYTVTGTDSDPEGDTGTWTFALTVS